jgi:hypothetical protein
MTKQQCLEIMMLLSALESWGFSNKQYHFPDYLLERLLDTIEVLRAEVLK